MEMRAGAILLMTAVVTATLTLGGCAGGEQLTQPDAATLLKLERRANIAYSEDRSKTAAALYADLVQAVPGEADYWYRLANSLARTERYDRAARAYEQTLARDPDNARAWHNLSAVRLLQAQMSLAKAVQRAQPGSAVYKDSQRLSAAVYSLTDSDSDRPPNATPVPKVPLPNSEDQP